jgi:hypothetical protein
MEVCSNCGHQLGVGRFCTNCGQRVDNAPTEVAVEPHPDPDAAPTLPPPAVEPPPQARYPLFADEAVRPVTSATPRISVPPPGPPPPEWFSRERTPPPKSRRAEGSRWLPWAVGGIGVLLFAMVGSLLLLTGDDDDPVATDRAGAIDTTEPATSGKPNKPRTPKPSETPPAGKGPLDLARYATAEVPDTAPPNVDVSGNQVRYEAAYLVDGLAETCWRMPGSGAGGEIVFTFQAPVELTEVGLINGYAKTSGEFDWYNGNRRVLGVEWVFDDGTTVEQTLDSTRDLQVLPIEPVTTSSVTLRLLEVSDPGSGRSARNFTAISDVSLVGEAA